MNVAIIDADLLGRKNHRFPNLVCMKLSSYFKSQGADVVFKQDYENLGEYDKVFISKVFMDSLIPYESNNINEKTESNIANYYKGNPILNLPNVEYGGTGFYYDKSPKLLYEIEHTMPDYHLYDEWVERQRERGVKEKDLVWYTDASIGFTTRGCIRKCKFCVNRNYNRCELHSPLDEFVNNDRSIICLLDDNIFACPNWKQVFDSLIATGKRFQFKQGCDERLMTDEKCEYLFNKSKWYGDIIFAFDNIKDKDLIISKLQMIRRHTSKQVKFYTFTGFNHLSPSYYDQDFYHRDFTELFERIEILMSYKCLPYVMRYKDCYTSPYDVAYTHIACWCNQPAFFKKKSFRQYVDTVQARVKSKSAATRALELIEKDFPDIAEKYFDIKFSDYDGCGHKVIC